MGLACINGSLIQAGHETACYDFQYLIYRENFDLLHLFRQLANVGRAEDKVTFVLRPDILMYYLFKDRFPDFAWKIDTTQAPADLSSSDGRGLVEVLDLNRLSPANREHLGILLLLPLGVLATEIMRQIMGIRTYGTFTPTLIALAIVHVDWLTATIIFMLVTVIGIVIRSYLPNLNLQRTPRLAIVFTLVSVSMSLVVSGFMYYDPGMDGFVVLLPVVILTMLVDRIYTIADTYGMRTAMIRLFWTVVSAFVSLIVLLQADWGIRLVSYPELHAATLAVIILIGLYKGPKLSSVPALSWLHEPETKTKKTRKPARKTDQSGQSSDSV